MNKARQKGPMDKRLIAIALSLLIVVMVMDLNADESSLLELAETLFAVPSPTGYEDPLVGLIQEILSEDYQTKRDNLGSLYLGSGQQNPLLAICAPMDEAGYFVSGIDPGGYLRLDKATSGPPLIDSYHLGHPMIVWTKRGPIEGVLALPSLHILNSEVREEFQLRPSLELAYLDIGVSSEEEARKKGVSMLDAVTPWRELTRLAGGKIAGHSLGLKLCTTLVLDVAKRVAAKVDSTTPLFVWMAQTKIPVRRSRPRASLGALRASKEIEAKGIVLVDVFPCDEQDQKGITIGNGPVLVYAKNKGAKLQERIQQSARDKGIPLQVAPDHSTSVAVPFFSNQDDVIGLLLPVKYSYTPSEVVDIKDLESLSSLLFDLLREGGMR